MVEILEEIMERHSGRAYSEKPVSDEAIKSILEAGRWAPSCSNTQAWNFVVLKDEDALKKGHEHLSRGNAWGKVVPVMVIVAAKEDAGCPSHGLPYFMMDVGLAVQNMLLQAVHIGLMGHPTAGWDEDGLKAAVGMPDDYRIVTVVFFGYRADLDSLDEETREKETTRTNRRRFDDVVHWNKW